jgi:hypothetical protein
LGGKSFFKHNITFVVHFCSIIFLFGLHSLAMACTILVQIPYAADFLEEVGINFFLWVEATFTSLWNHVGVGDMAFQGDYIFTIWPCLTLRGETVM